MGASLDPLRTCPGARGRAGRTQAEGSRRPLRLLRHLCPSFSAPRLALAAVGITLLGLAALSAFPWGGGGPQGPPTTPRLHVMDTSGGMDLIIGSGVSCDQSGNCQPASGSGGWCEIGPQASYRACPSFSPGETLSGFAVIYVTNVCGPLGNQCANDYTSIAWGDGTVSSALDAQVTASHAYSNPGTYTVVGETQYPSNPSSSLTLTIMNIAAVGSGIASAASLGAAAFAFTTPGLPASASAGGASLAGASISPPSSLGPAGVSPTTVSPTVPTSFTGSMPVSSFPSAPGSADLGFGSYMVQPTGGNLVQIPKLADESYWLVPSSGGPPVMLPKGPDWELVVPKDGPPFWPPPGSVAQSPPGLGIVLGYLNHGAGTHYTVTSYGYAG